MATATRKRTPKGGAKKSDAYQIITGRILSALEAGIVPWRQPWDSTTGAPRSLSSGKPYRGINVFMLLMTSLASGYKSPWWGTYKQITERGGQVRKGEKGTPVVFWRLLEVRDDKAEDGIKKIPLLRYFTVFNSEQADGENFRVPEFETDADYVEPVDAADAIIQRYIDDDGPSLSYGGNRAFYNPPTDSVRIPDTAAFHSTEGHYSVIFHELGHSTGHESRLKRDGVTDPIKFGSETYGKEELIAEMTAAFLCAESGVEQEVEYHAGYIGSWIRAISGDPKLVVQAAGAAQRKTDLILGRKYETETETKEEAA